MTQDHGLTATRRIAALLRDEVDIPLSLKLWDGTIEPLGRDLSHPLAIALTSPGVLPSLLRRPTLDRLIRHYVGGHIEIEGGSWIDLGRCLAGDREIKRRLRKLPRGRLALLAARLAFGKAGRVPQVRGFSGNAEGANSATRENDAFIKFHYDVGNDFYKLFLDPEMQYSCAYFPTGTETLEEAQRAKLDMICRKLRLSEGDRFLDIGCGWGGLMRHAARHYGVTVHGITLSPSQAEETRARLQADGLAERATVEVVDYQDLQGQFDKVASVGMYEHIGLANIPGYFQKIRSLLHPDGLFLNHAISRGGKRKKTRFAKRPEQRALQKYIFPGGELDDIGHTIAEMEIAKLEVHDVEAWRRHYQRTTEIWCERLSARRAEAEALVGAPTYQLWTAYLAGCSFAFQRGSARIYQTLASYSAKGLPPLPPSRADLYADD